MWLFFSHSSLAHIFLFESTLHKFPKDSGYLASAPPLTDNHRLDKPFLTLAFSVVWPLIWMECPNGALQNLSQQLSTVSKFLFTSDLWGGRNGEGEVFNSFEVYVFNSLMKVGKRWSKGKESSLHTYMFLSKDPFCFYGNRPVDASTAAGPFQCICKGTSLLN